MQNFLGILILVAGCVLFFVDPVLMAELADSFDTAPFDFPVSETGCWLIGVSAGIGYMIWWLLDLLFGRERHAGLGSFLLYAAIMAPIIAFRGGFLYVDAGVSLGGFIYALLTHVTTPTADTIEESP